MKMTQSIDSMDYDGSFQYLLTTWQREDPNHVSPQWPKLVGTSAKFGFSQNFQHKTCPKKSVQQDAHVAAGFWTMAGGTRTARSRGAKAPPNVSRQFPNFAKQLHLS